MKVKVDRADLIVLVPETDADFALLHLWSENHQTYIASSTYADGKTELLRIGFSNNQTAKPEPPKPSQNIEYNDYS